MVVRKLFVAAELSNLHPLATMLSVRLCVPAVVEVPTVELDVRFLFFRNLLHFRLTRLRIPVIPSSANCCSVIRKGNSRFDIAERSSHSLFVAVVFFVWQLLALEIVVHLVRLLGLLGLLILPQIVI